MYPKERKAKDRSHLRYRLDCDLAYDGGGSRWSSYHKTKIGAKISAWYHYHIASWGGSIDLVDQQTGAVE